MVVEAVDDPTDFGLGHLAGETPDVKPIDQTVPLRRGHLGGRRKGRLGGDAVAEQDAVLIMHEDAEPGFVHPGGVRRGGWNFHKGPAAESEEQEAWRQCVGDASRSGGQISGARVHG